MCQVFCGCWADCHPASERSSEADERVYRYHGKAERDLYGGAEHKAYGRPEPGAPCVHENDRNGPEKDFKEHGLFYLLSGGLSRGG